MEPNVPLTTAVTTRRRPEPSDLDLLPSRRLARAAIRGALARKRGLVALTGEPGSGKTTLWQSLQAERRADESWLVIEVGPAAGPRDLYRLIAQALHASPGWFGRPELAETLASASLNGQRWTLVIDEAQNLDLNALEEVRVLSNRLGESDGLAAILLVGQTPLAGRDIRPGCRRPVGGPRSPQAPRCRRGRPSARSPRAGPAMARGRRGPYSSRNPGTAWGRRRTGLDGPARQVGP
jgi:hypothetical protein